MPLPKHIRIGEDAYIRTMKEYYEMVHAQPGAVSLTSERRQTIIKFFFAHRN